MNVLEGEYDVNTSCHLTRQGLLDSSDAYDKKLSTLQAWRRLIFQDTES